MFNDEMEILLGGTSSKTNKNNDKLSIQNVILILTQLDGLQSMLLNVLFFSRKPFYRLSRINHGNFLSTIFSYISLGDLLHCSPKQLCTYSNKKGFPNQW